MARPAAATTRLVAVFEAALSGVQKAADFATAVSSGEAAATAAAVSNTATGPEGAVRSRGVVASGVAPVRHSGSSRTDTYASSALTPASETGAPSTTPRPAATTSGKATASAAGFLDTTATTVAGTRQKITPAT